MKKKSAEKSIRIYTPSREWEGALGFDDKGENDYEEVGKLVWGLRKALLGYLVGYFGLLPPRLCSAYSVTKQPKTYDFGDQNHRFWQSPFSTKKDKNGKHLILSGL